MEYSEKCMPQDWHLIEALEVEENDVWSAKSRAGVELKGIWIWACKPEWMRKSKTDSNRRRVL